MPKQLQIPEWMGSFISNLHVQQEISLMTTVFLQLTMAVVPKAAIHPKLKFFLTIMSSLRAAISMIFAIAFVEVQTSRLILKNVTMNLNPAWMENAKSTVSKSNGMSEEQWRSYARQALISIGQVWF